MGIIKYIIPLSIVYGSISKRKLDYVVVSIRSCIYNIGNGFMPSNAALVGWRFVYLGCA